MIEECLAVEFRIRDDGCPLADATQATSVEINAQPPQLRADGYALLQFSSTRSERLVETLDADDRIRYLHVSRADGRYRYRCLSKQPCVVHDLIDGGFIVERLRYRNGDAAFFGAVVGREVLKGVMETASETVGVQLERVYPLQAEAEDLPSQRWDLTPAQEECIRVALELGYFAIPREASSEAVADELGISKSAFLERLRRAETSLFQQIFA